MVTVAVLSVVAVFAAAVIVTVPSPEPFVVSTDNHEVFSETVQSILAVTSTVCEPPSASNSSIEETVRRSV